MNIEITGIAYLIFLVIVLLLTIQLAILTKIIVDVRKYVQHNGLDLMELYNVSGLLRTVNKKVEAARKRDEKLLRELHAEGKNADVHFDEVKDKIDDTDTKIVAGNKKIITIDCNVGRLVNSNIEDQAKLGFIKKGVEKMTPVLVLLEDMVKKAKAKKC